MRLDQPENSSPSRRRFLAVSATALAVSPAALSLPSLAQTPTPLGTQAVAAVGGNDTRIRPFKVSIPQTEIVDLRRRIAATKWPSKELVTDASQGVQLATMR